MLGAFASLVVAIGAFFGVMWGDQNHNDTVANAFGIVQVGAIAFGTMSVFRGRAVATRRIERHLDSFSQPPADD